MLNKKGESLITVMVAMGIAGLVIAGLMAGLESGERARKATQVGAESDSLFLSITNEIKNTDACQYVLMDNPFTPSAAVGTPGPYFNVSLDMPFNDTRGPITQGLKLQNFQITNMEMQDTGVAPQTVNFDLGDGSGPQNYTSYMAQLRLGTQKLNVNGAALPGSPNSKLLTVQTNVFVDSTGKIVTCSAPGTTSFTKGTLHIPGPWSVITGAAGSYTDDSGGRYEVSPGTQQIRINPASSGSGRFLVEVIGFFSYASACAGGGGNVTFSYNVTVAGTVVGGTSNSIGTGTHKCDFVWTSDLSVPVTAVFRANPGDVIQLTPGNKYDFLITEL